jgi:toxin-antitoxin system PIN domain toxin
MMIVDLNLLIYATNSDSPHHEQARAWLEQAISGYERIGLAWMVILGFLRITTNGRIMPRPLQAEQAVRVVDGWIDHPNVSLVAPGERHWAILKRIAAPLGLAGNLISDSHLAAIAIEHGATLCSADSDFGRFESLKWINPLDQSD